MQFSPALQCFRPVEQLRFLFLSAAQADTGPDDTTTPEEAREAVATASRFVAEFSELAPLIDPDGRTSGGSSP